MPTSSLGRLLSVAFLGSSLLACSPAYGDKPRTSPATPAQALAIAPAAQRSPYEVTIRREDGAGVATFAHRGRYYVLGAAGERYIIHVSNPTDRRVEAVVTVDGLDVIDGEDGDLGKRGYIVPPHGDLDIDGFRTSTDQVATFRFSSVDGSYAGKKGKARNVGVIAVAIFDEKAAPAVVVDESEGRDRRDQREEERWMPPTTPVPTESHWRGAADGDAKADRAAPSAEATATVGGAGAGGRVAPSVDDMPAGAMAPMPPPDWYRPPPPPVDKPEPAPKTGRLGLGTEFGESRYSATTFTRFERSSAAPIAVAELRYNDAPGLTSLGIAITPPPTSGELDTRETADPFPGSRFATPPR